jgi:hypothetical protein
MDGAGDQRPGKATALPPANGERMGHIGHFLHRRSFLAEGHPVWKPNHLDGIRPVCGRMWGAAVRHETVLRKTHIMGPFGIHAQAAPVMAKDGLAYGAQPRPDLGGIAAE